MPLPIDYIYGDMGVQLDLLLLSMRVCLCQDCTPCGTERISMAFGMDGCGREGVLPRCSLYAPPLDLAEDLGSEKGLGNGAFSRGGLSQAPEPAETMARPRPVTMRRPDETGHDGWADDRLGSALR